jgi:hypothetical protein
MPVTVPPQETSTTVTSNEERNLLLRDTTTTADFSPDKAGFEMTGVGCFIGAQDRNPPFKKSST